MTLHTGALHVATSFVVIRRFTRVCVYDSDRNTENESCDCQNVEHWVRTSESPNFLVHSRNRTFSRAESDHHLASSFENALQPSSVKATLDCHNAGCRFSQWWSKLHYWNIGYALVEILLEWMNHYMPNSWKFCPIKDCQQLCLGREATQTIPTKNPTTDP